MDGPGKRRFTQSGLDSSSQTPISARVSDYFQVGTSSGVGPLAREINIDANDENLSAVEGNVVSTTTTGMVIRDLDIAFDFL